MGLCGGQGPEAEWALIARDGAPGKQEEMQIPIRLESRSRFSLRAGFRLRLALLGIAQDDTS